MRTWSPPILGMFFDVSCLPQGENVFCRTAWMYRNACLIFLMITSFTLEENIGFIYRQYLVVACLGYNNTTRGELLEVLFSLQKSEGSWCYMPQHTYTKQAFTKQGLSFSSVFVTVSKFWFSLLLQWTFV